MTIRQELINEIIALDVSADELLAAINARKVQIELASVAKCPKCESFQVGYYRADSDWSCGRWQPANDHKYYTTAQIDRFANNERSDIDIHICLHCRHVWNKYE